MNKWRRLSESSPPLGSTVFLFQPGRDDGRDHIWQVYVGSGGMIQFELPMQMWLDYSEEDNEQFMKETLSTCTHWVPMWDAVEPPEIEQ